ncbi:MAG: hypothetical protein DCF19_19195 [Pseudanabaena frigida]|uniref:Uncharacterized protein n=1 Tax=Pseudanabaena frigida TaxID=945775 RepID=A0A2W4W1D4_9CYAN|nr:MAG: hypothetical protein DCF19_19195 [Pseudanabaena frigida]
MSKFSTKAVCNFTKRFACKVAINSAIAIVTTASAHGTLPNWEELSDIVCKSTFVAVQQEVLKHLHPKKQKAKPALSESKNEKGDR